MASKRRTSSRDAKDNLCGAVRTSSTSGLASKQSANCGSTRTVMRNFGNCAFNARTGPVSSRQSPNERRRMKRMRAVPGRRWKSCLVFNLGFVDQHHRNVVANRIHPAALDTLQTLAVFREVHLRFAEWADKNLQKLRIHGHGQDLTTAVLA